MRVKCFAWLCVALFSGLMIQACLTDAGKDKSGSVSTTGINGKWLKVRMVSELSVGGTTVADTLDYDTSDLDREFLVIHDSTFLKVTYNFLEGAVDTIDLEAHAAASNWELEGDTVTITSTGNLLKVVTSSAGGLSTRDEYVLHTAGFPPASWGPDTTGTDTTASGSVTSWILNRDIYSVTDSAGTRRDTNDYAGRQEEDLFYLRIYADSLVAVNLPDTALLSDTRIDAAHWLTRGDDTLTLSVTGTKLTVLSTYYDAENNVRTTTRNEYTRISVFPPANWNATPPTNATPVTVDVDEITDTLGENVTNWYSFTAGAGKTYYLRTTSTSDGVDTYIRLYSSTGERLAWNDDDEDYLAVGYNAGLQWTAPASGTYCFSVRGFDDIEVGSYKVMVGKINVIPKRAALPAVPKVKVPKR